jgi:2-polyprenyl-6-methoxyphenol hydroxylase-like FAD-dependent oxidoreductase
LFSRRDKFAAIYNTNFTTIEFRLGFSLHSLERKQIIQVLFDNLKDKSKIHTGQRVTSIKSTQTVVTVRTEDGSTWTGSILVGADGVRSTVRQKMWGMAQEERSGHIGEDDGKGAFP